MKKISKKHREELVKNLKERIEHLNVLIEHDFHPFAIKSFANTIRRDRIKYGIYECF